MSSVDSSDLEEDDVQINFRHFKENLSTEKIEELGKMTVKLLKLYRKKKSTSDAEFRERMTRSIGDGRTQLENVFLRGKSKGEKLKAFQCLIRLLPWINSVDVEERFPLQFYGDLIRLVIVQEDDATHFTQCLKDLLEYEDMRRNYWLALDVAIAAIGILTPGQISHFIKVTNLWGRKKERNGDDMTKFYYCGMKEGPLSPKEFHKCIQRIWNRIVQTVNLPESVHQNLLVTLIETFMPRMDRPIFLHDYFMGCLQQGGAIGLLGLQGIFVLIQKHNLNYPNIYAKLYSMFSPEIFGTYYKARFYYLSDVFLSSTHLPESLVAGFAKRIARLCVVAPPTDALILLTFISNLLIRHPGLQKMTSNTDSLNKDSDPYLEDEPDPARSRALESSLWEIRLLQEHALPGVAAAAMFINRPLPSVEQDMSRLLESNSNDIFEREVKKKMKAPPLTFDRPTKTFLSRPSTRQGFSVWSL